jgi:hypothetical protein
MYRPEKPPDGKAFSEIFVKTAPAANVINNRRTESRCGGFRLFDKLEFVC